jgi:arylsulfatase A-like enzyme
VHHNSGPEGGGAFDDSTSLATMLKDQAGYRTAYIGKYLNGYHKISAPPGWDEWRVYHGQYDLDYRGYYSYTLNINGELVYYGTEPEDYSTDVFTQQAVDFIHGYDGQPFFLTVSFFAPHSPAIPAPRHEGAFDGIPPWRPASFDEENISDKPAWFNDLEPLDYEEIDQTRQGQLESLLAVDEGISALIGALQDVGQQTNTAIIYTSDNGLTWGEHRMFGKSCPHEECIRVPLLFWYPPYTHGSVRDHLALNIDLLPSIAWLAGTGLPPEVDGERLFANPNVYIRRDFLLEHWIYDYRDSPINEASVIPDYQGLRAPRWTYVEYATQEGELYDLKLDSYQLVSVFDHPVYAGVKDKLAQRLENLAPP